MDKFHHFNPNCTLPNQEPIGCFSVILLCTWSILRPNVPPEPIPKGWRQRIYKKAYLVCRRVYWKGVMLIGPEFLTTFTTKKMLGTKKNVAELKRLARKPTEWDLPQTILAGMEGIIVYFSDSEVQDKNNEKTERSPGNRSKTHRSSQEAQSSRGDKRQSKWLGECKIPWKRHEPHVKHAIKMKEALGENPPHWKLLNIATLSGNMWTLDSKQLAIAKWDKPKDINTPVYVKAAKLSVSEEGFMEIANKAPFPYMQQRFWQYKHYSMPTIAFHETDGDLKHIDRQSLVVAMTTIISFGGIHLLAWNLQFPTPVEGLLWKISATMTIVWPCWIRLLRCHLDDILRPQCSE
ncbi:hypothetical protein LI328DRAFT_166521 [Trichoderma asperelloides]|nr:hypothetical protein LI328DRAFT_166521 [Trichoderma asperelloides]